jgi:hypothetical protein
MNENVMLFIARSSLPGNDWKNWLEDNKIVAGFEIQADSTEILSDGLNGLIVLVRNPKTTDSVPSKPVHPTPPPVHFSLPDGISYGLLLGDFQIPKQSLGFGSIGGGENFADASLLADEEE